VFGGDPADLAGVLRAHIEELGGVFLLFGKALSIRYDCLPVSFCEVLSKTPDCSPPLDAAAVTRTIESELGKPLQESFSFFDDKFTGSNWLSQTHKAAITADDPVMVIVRRPGLTPIVEADLAALGHILTLLDFFAIPRRLQLARQFPDFRRRILQGLSLLTEARNMERLAAQASNNPHEYIPHVYHSHTTANMLTVEQLEGTPLSEITDALARTPSPLTSLGELPAGQIDPKKIARNLLFNHLHQILNGKYLHCDPTPEVMVVLDDNVIGYRDCWAVQRIDSPFFERQLEVISAVRASDVSSLVQTMWEYVDAPIDAPVAEFEASVRELVSEWLDLADDARATPADRDVRLLFVKILENFRRFQILAPAAILVYYHVFATTIATIQSLAQDFDLRAEMSDLFQRMLTERIEKEIDTRTITQTVLEYEQFLVTLPRQVRQVLRAAQQDQSPVMRSVNPWELRAWSLLRVLATFSMLAAVAVWIWRQWKPTSVSAAYSSPAILLTMLFGALAVRHISRIGYDRCAMGRRRMRWSRAHIA